MRLLNSVILSLVLLLYGCGDPVFAGSTIKPDAVVKVHDGDTFLINITGCPDVLCLHVPVRMSGIDAPEMRGKCQKEKAGALVAKDFLVRKLSSASPGTIELRNVSRDKYFRINADVWVGGVNIGQEMISKGIARPYNGGKRGGWCDQQQSGSGMLVTATRLQ